MTREIARGGTHPRRPDGEEPRRRLARRVLVTFLATLGAEFLVLLLRAVNAYGNKTRPRPGGRPAAQSQSDAASGTAARSTRAIAPLTQTDRQMPQP
jgi:hypothetical protein